MFAYIKGTVTEIGTDEIIVETGGIGFSVFTSSQDSARLTKNQQANCRTVMHFWRTVPRKAGVCKNLAVLSPKRGSLGQEIGFFPS